MAQNLNVISRCEVCGNSQLVPVLDLGMHPMCDDLVEVGASRVCREYPIDILFCDQCITAHQHYQIPKAELFPQSYHYRSRFTADVLSGMKLLVESCATRFGGLDGKLVLDVGCNDGSLLDFFRQAGARTVGVEPTSACLDAAAKGHPSFHAFFEPDVAAALVKAHGQPDFITFTNVFAHIEDLGQLLDALRPLISPSTVIVIENHYLGAVLDGNQFDTFYHEHPRTYSCTSFQHIARNLGLGLLDVEFPARYGGNIRVFIGHGEAAATSAERDEVLRREAGFHARFDAMRTGIALWQARKTAQIAALVAKHGPLHAKAFPGRAAILVKLLHLDVGSVAVTHERPGSMKIGHYLPGTRIPIASDDDLFALPDQNAPVLNFAWHISAEIRTYLTANGYRGEVVDILSREDFAPPA